MDLTSRFYLLLIRLGRIVAKAFNLESNPLALRLRKAILGQVLRKADSYIIHYWGRDLELDADQSMLPGLLNHTYEPHELEFVKNTLKEGDVFFDIGANFGLYSVLASQCVGQSGKVFSFEPAPRTFGFLEKNTADLPNVFRLNYAVGNRSGEIGFQFHEANAGCSSILEGQTPSGLRVPLVTIDQLFEDKKLPRPSVVKIDVEGFEMEVLQGLLRTITKETIILCEFNARLLERAGKSPKEVLDFLLKNFSVIESIHEITGKREKAFRPEDLSGRLFSNLILTGFRAS